MSVWFVCNKPFHVIKYGSYCHMTMNGRVMDPHPRLLSTSFFSVLFFLSLSFFLPPLQPHLESVSRYLLKTVWSLSFGILVHLPKSFVPSVGLIV